MSMRKHAIRRDAGRHLTDRQREILGRAWNRYVSSLVSISLREFARLHNVPYETWRRKARGFRTYEGFATMICLVPGK